MCHTRQAEEQTPMGFLSYISDFVRLAMAAFLAVCITHQAAGQTALQRGLAALRDGDASAARAYLRTAVREQPSSPTARNSLGIALSRTGAWAPAVEEFRTAVHLDPQYPEALFNLGIALSSIGQHSEGIASLRSALAIRPEFPEAVQALAVALAARGDAAAATEALQAALENGPASASAHGQLGSLYMQEGNEPLAVFHARKAADLEPNSAEFATNLGITLQRTGEVAEASDVLRRAVSLDRSSPLALRTLALTLQDRGAYESATRHLRELVSLQPSARHFADLGYALLRSDRLIEAKKKLRRAIHLSPESSRPHYLLARSLELTGESGAALREYGLASSLSPENPDYRLQYGSALARVDPQAAAVELREAVRLYAADDESRRGTNPDPLVSAHFALGSALLKLGDQQGAKRHFRQAEELRSLEHSRLQSLVLLNRGIELLNDGDLGEAIHILRRCLALAPQFPEGLHMLATAYAAVGQWTRAGEAFAAALEQRPDDPQIRLSFGRSLLAQGELRGAILELEAVIASDPGHARARCLLAESLARLGQRERAGIEFRRAAELGTCELPTGP